jgi:hypothetical protein
MKIARQILSYVPWIIRKVKLEVMKDTPTLLTYSEAALLGAFGSLFEAFAPEVAVVARLTPTETEEALAGLKKKSLVELLDRNGLVRLTHKGKQAKLNWTFEDEGISKNKESSFRCSSISSLSGRRLDDALKSEIKNL